MERRARSALRAQALADAQYASMRDHARAADRSALLPAACSVESPEKGN
jgi:hypothetical protein